MLEWATARRYLNWNPARIAKLPKDRSATNPDAARPSLEVALVGVAGESGQLCEWSSPFVRNIVLDGGDEALESSDSSEVADREAGGSSCSAAVGRDLRLADARRQHCCEDAAQGTSTGLSAVATVGVTTDAEDVFERSDGADEFMDRAGIEVGPAARGESEPDHLVARADRFDVCFGRGPKEHRPIAAAPADFDTTVG